MSDLFKTLKPGLKKFLGDSIKGVCIDGADAYAEAFFDTLEERGINPGSLVSGISDSMKEEIRLEMKDKGEEILIPEKFCDNPRCMPCLINKKLDNTDAKSIKSRLKEDHGSNVMEGFDWLMSAANKVSDNKSSVNNELAKQAIIIQTILLIKSAIADDLLESRAELLEENDKLRQTIDMLATVH